MNGIKTFLERIAERQSSFVLFGNRIYDFADSAKYPDFMAVSGISLALVPSLAFSDFERLDDSLFAKQVTEYCTEYVKSTIDREIKAEAEIKGEQDRIKTLDFIMHQFLPFLVSKKYLDDETLRQEIEDHDKEGSLAETPLEKASLEIIAKLNADFGDELTKDSKEDASERLKSAILKKERDGLKNPVWPSRITLEQMGLANVGLKPSILGSMISNQPVYVSAGRTVLLELIPDGQKPAINGQISFRINNSNYAISQKEGIPLQQMIAELEDRRLRNWRIEAIEKSQSAFAMIKDLVKAEEIGRLHLTSLAKLDNYDIDGSGFIRNGSEYLVYATVPRFATQDGRVPERYWPFDATRVAIKIGWSEGKPYTTDHAIVIESRPFHPCLSNRRNPNGHCTLCNLNEKAYGYTVSDMIRKLSESANVFMQPLNKQSLDSHYGHTYFGDALDDILKQGSLTRDEAIENGYMVVEVLDKKMNEVPLE